MKAKKAVQLALLLVIAAGVIYTLLPYMEKPQARAVVGEAAPVFTLINLQGEPVQLADYKGRGVLINFWASWCNPCVNELPLLNEAYKLSGIDVLAVNVGEKGEKAQAFVDRYELKFPVVLDEEMEVKRHYRVVAMPLTLLVDRDGELIARHEGELTEMSDILDLMNQLKSKANK
jgi:peroxiredoxin